MSVVSGSVKTWCLGLCLVSAILLGCKKGNSNNGGKTTTRRGTKPTQRGVANAGTPGVSVKMDKEWLNSLALESIAGDFNILVKMLREAKPPQKADTLALMLNRYKKVANGERLKPKKISPTHRALRARLHLRLARFYREAYSVSLRNQAEYLRRRLKRKGKLKLGQLFYFYYGRLLCLQGQYKEAASIFQVASEQTAASHKLRVKAWAAVCQKDSSARAKGASVLASTDWTKEPAGAAEALILKSFFGLSSKLKLPASLDARASMFQNIASQKPWKPNAKVMTAVVDNESIKEGEISTTFSYFDPVVAWAAKVYHANAALEYLALASKKDLFAPFFQGQAYALKNDDKNAIASWQLFLKQPPKAFDWGYVLYSSFVRLADFVSEAKLQVALAQHRLGQTKEAKQSLGALFEKGYPTKMFAAFGLLQVGDKAQRKAAWDAIAGGVELARFWEPRLLKRYLKLKGSKKGAAAIEQFRLYKYAVRLLLFRASQAALQLGFSDKAVRWMELLHHKDKPYVIANDNQPAQIVWTMRAYEMAGRWDVAGLFAARNKGTFPVLTQHWSTYRLLRITRGMGNPRGPKGG
ncbi:MAG: hypothetical protein EP343_30935 [Deltaproteobacteria bacterium]|nr:MAG: hypothetical protein EP343_30935 [Deltaproteobacteria bacterium]